MNPRSTVRTLAASDPQWSNPSARDADLEAGIEDGQLVLQYQPKIGLRGQNLIGFEALVRWNHPNRGWLVPGEFLPSAERSGAAIPLNRWVLNQACRQMSNWHKSFAMNTPLTMSVNISCKYLSDPCLILDLQRILAETELPPESLRLEITERSLVTCGGTAEFTLRKLKKMQIGLEIDGFGTGPASLSYLRKLPFDALNIDRSFVKKLGARNDSSQIINSIMAFVNHLGIDAAAQGVETEEQFRTLTALGCRRAQGYYFSRPVGAGAAREIIRDEER